MRAAEHLNQNEKVYSVSEYRERSEAIGSDREFRTRAEGVGSFEESRLGQRTTKRSALDFLAGHHDHLELENPAQIVVASPGDREVPGFQPSSLGSSVSSVPSSGLSYGLTKRNK